MGKLPESALLTEGCRLGENGSLPAVIGGTESLPAVESWRDVRPEKEASEGCLRSCLLSHEYAASEPTGPKFSLSAWHAEAAGLGNKVVSRGQCHECQDPRQL